MFAIVEFPLSKEVEPVPKSWICKDGHCWWPNYRSFSKIKQAIIRMEEPNSDNYTSYPARILKYYGTYDAALADATRAQFDSDLNSEPETTPKSRNLRQRPPKRTIEMSSDEEESNSSVSMPPPLLPSPPVMESTLPETRNGNKRGKQLHGADLRVKEPYPLSVATGSQNGNARVNAPSHVLGLVSIDNPSSSSIDLLPQPISLPSTSTANVDDHSSTERSTDGVGQLSNSSSDSTMPTANFQAWVVRHLGILKAQMSQVQESVDVLVHGQKASQNDHQSVESQDLPSLPIRNMEELTSVNEILLDDAKRRALVMQLARRGGQTLRECVRRILQVLVSNEMAMTFNWIGSRGDKMGFKNTILLHVVYDAVRSNRRMDNADEKLMELAIKDWLKNAKKRSTKDKSREEPSGNQ